MLRLRADVNGRPIGWVLIHNTGRRGPLGMSIYDAGTYDPATGDGVAGLEGIYHYRSWGWQELALSVLANAVEVIRGR